MHNLLIGQAARRAGLSTSAIRFYEKSGLLPVPNRISKRRCYDESIFARLHLIRISTDAGFTIAETRRFLTGFSKDTPPSARWRELATRKLKELEAQMERSRQMKALLESGFQCGCRNITDCEQLIRDAHRERRSAKNS